MVTYQQPQTTKFRNIIMLSRIEVKRGNMLIMLLAVQSLCFRNFGLGFADFWAVSELVHVWRKSGLGSILVAAPD